jgi:hypothetical protein
MSNWRDKVGVQRTCTSTCDVSWIWLVSVVVWKSTCLQLLWPSFADRSPVTLSVGRWVWRLRFDYDWRVLVTRLVVILLATRRHISQLHLTSSSDEFRGLHPRIHVYMYTCTRAERGARYVQNIPNIKNEQPIYQSHSWITIMYLYDHIPHLRCCVITYVFLITSPFRPTYLGLFSDILRLTLLV